MGWRIHGMAGDENMQDPDCDMLLFWPFTVFVSAFFSATLLPGASEGVLAAGILKGGSVPLLVASATMGNLLGAATTFLIGRLAGERVADRWFGMPQDRKAQARRLVRTYGPWALLFSWLPVIGDPLVLVAGLFGMGGTSFFVFTALGKFLRYSFVAWVTVLGGSVLGGPV